jgi:hypothetical protein
MSSDWDDYTLDIKLLKHYQSITGVLKLRFDVAYHISVLAQYMARRTEKLAQEAYRVMGYLVGTTTSRSVTTHRHTLNCETEYMLCVMPVLKMTDYQGKVNKDT